MVRAIIFDWKRTLYDPDNRVLIDGATELLEYIRRKNIKMILMGKGGEDMQKEVERLRVEQFFSHIVFAEGEKDPKVFAKYIEESKRTLFIGDRVRSELEIGNKLGATTVWIKQGKFAQEEPENKQQEPNYTVASLNDCLNLLKGLI